MDGHALRASFESRGGATPEQWAADVYCRLLSGSLSPAHAEADSREVLVEALSALELEEDDWDVLLLFLLMDLARLFAQDGGGPREAAGDGRQARE